MISMSKIHSIRQLRQDGLSITDTSKSLDVSRNTVYKYLEEQDLSPQMPIAKEKKSVLDLLCSFEACHKHTQMNIA